MSTNRLFIIILRFTGNKALAEELMDAHLAYVKQGFDDGVFFIGGPITLDQGGGLIAQGDSREEIDLRVATDPFVKNEVVQAEIIEIEPLYMDKRMESFFRT